MGLEKKLKYLSFFPVIKKKNYKNLTKMQQNATIILTKGRSIFFFCWCNCWLTVCTYNMVGKNHLLLSKQGFFPTEGVQYEIQDAAGLPRWSGNNKYVQPTQYRHDGVQ